MTHIQFSRLIKSCLIWRIMLLVMATALLSLSGRAQDPVLVSVLEGKKGSIKKDSLRETVDLIYYSPLVDSILDPLKDRYINSVSLYINEDFPVPAASDFKAEVFVTLIWTSMSGHIDSADKKLTIQYKLGQDSASRVRDYVRMDSCRKLTVRVDSVSLNGILWDATRMLVLENRMEVYRDYKFDCHSLVEGLAHETGPLSASFNFDKLIVSWDPAVEPGITHYDLEWSWIDFEALERYKVSPGSPDFDPVKIFRNNSTRVTIAASDNSYGLPLIYDGEGYLFYRVRRVQEKTDGSVLTGDWAAQASDYFHYENGHESALNWQVTTSFAEEGKHKTVIQYFDGTLRNRQSVTKDNDTETTIIAETLYDYQGRPSINILPAPTLNQVIEYAHNFNRFTTDVYPKQLYDIVPVDFDVCNVKPEPLDSISGASQYYSSNNPLISEFITSEHNYIPAAFGFPYTETRYTPDATGRIAAQGGVGPLYQVNEGHETKYYYGEADQKELDALFGTEVGKSMHYFKNMVRDGNGQYSVSYVDMRGRTVATALAGKVPDSLEQLPGFQQRYFTRNLLSEGNNRVKDRTVESSTTLLVTRPGVHQFHYELSPQSAEIVACNPEEGKTTACYDCYYDLEIRITAECLPEPIIITRRNFSFGNYDVSCAESAPNLVVDTSFSLNEGEYNITKTLRLSKDAQDWYRKNLFTLRNICKTLQDFYDDSYEILQNADNCSLSCGTCKDQLGEYEDFRNAFLVSQGVNPATTVPYEAEIKENYEKALADCELLCTPPAENKLEMIRQLMLMDMVPDEGQYGRLDKDVNGNGVIDDGPAGDDGSGFSVYERNTNKPYNIFNPARPYNFSLFNPVQFSLPLPAFANPRYAGDNNTTHYKDQYGQKDASLPQNAPPASMLPGDFAKLFPRRWAEALIYQHPEYDRLAFAETNLKASYDWDVTLENTETWADAVAAGFISNNILNLDPFFSSSLANNVTTRRYWPLVFKMNDLMERFLEDEYQDYGKTIWQLAWIGVTCQENDLSCINRFNKKPPFATGGYCDADLNAVWKTFRTIYLSEKEKMISEVIFDATTNRSRDNILDNTAYLYQRRFIDYNNLDGLVGVNNENQAQQVLDEEWAELEDVTCKGYIDLWTNRLLECEAIRESDDVEDILREIMIGLVNVCKRGADWQHPEGSSTVPPGDNAAPRSFEQVIAAVLAKYEITESMTCHPYLINYPQPYDRQSPTANPQVVQAKDDCMCSRLQELETNKTQSAFSGNLSQYISAQHGITIRQTFLDSLQSGCEGTCNIYDPAISIPAILDCETSLNNCIDCQQYDALKSEFISKYPAHNSVFNEDPDTDEELNENVFLSQFLNARTGFSRHWGEYLEFEKICLGYDTTWSCNGLQAIVTLYMDNGGDTVSAANCNTVFTNFFNTQAGTAYTFGQIQQLFLEHCDGLPDICAPVLYCSGFNAIIDSFYVRYGAVVRSNISCDSLFTDHFNEWQGTAYTYAELQDLYRRTCGKILDVCKGLDCERLQNVLDAWKSCNPIVFMSAQCDSLWTVYFNAQMGTSFTSPQIDSIYQQCGIVYNPCQVKSDCSTLKRLLFSYQNMDTLACAPAGLNTSDPDYCNDCFAWFINDKLGTSYSYSQVAQLYLEQCGVILQICKKSFDCLTLSNLANDFTQWQKDNPGEGPCDSLFTVQFNEYFDLDFTYQQILQVYKRHCGKTLEFCAPMPAVNCQQLQDIRQSFRQIYPDPSRYFGDSCEVGFTRFYNAITGDTLTFDEIRMQYFILCLEDLDICVPDSCARFTQLADDFETEFGAFRIPRQLARDMFATYFNRQIRPLTPYLWNDITRVYDSCGAVLPDFPPDTSYQLDYNKVYDANRAFNVLYQNLTDAECGRLFTDMVNTYFGASFENAQQLQQWLNDNRPMEASKFIVCGVLETPVRLLLRTTAVPVTTILPPRLCNTVIVPSIVVDDADPCDYHQTMALHIATQQYQAYIQQAYENFDSTYRAKCLDNNMGEVFTVRAQAAEYHFTLYYYDQAGNLVKTVPPAGVDLTHMGNEEDYEGWHEDVVAARNTNAILTPGHMLETHYRYNSLNQVVSQKSPDAGLSLFYYDRLGRLVVSRNAKQNVEGKYSYTRYDLLGRISEVGQIGGTGVDQELTQDQETLDSWMATNSNSREQITTTIYDLPSPALVLSPETRQTNVRNRVSYTMLTDLATDLDYASASYYYYDIHGNVNQLLNHYFKGVMHDVEGHAFKKLKYKYDLISGKVNEVAYQPGMRDEFYHKYEYDASNRLVNVLTSHDYLHWEQQAAYKYYKHGPLARTELGQMKVQGLDYAYTLQGWLKGVNSAAIGSSFDIGADGRSQMSAARDAFSFQLQYNQQDYKAIREDTYPFVIAHVLPNQVDALKTGRSLFNGNISSMLVNIPQLGEAHLYGYAYDQLNRIVGMNANTGLNGTTGALVPVAASNNNYLERVSYDANGNIETYKRNGEGVNAAMDDLTYNYSKTSGRLNRNQLLWVDDAVTGNPVDYGDIKTQSSGYYEYDQIGNLVREGPEDDKHTRISWNVYGKISEIRKMDDIVTEETIRYTYDVTGNRIGKWRQVGLGTPRQTWYVRDASGNVMAVYEKGNAEMNSGDLTQIEVPLYGSSRLGMWHPQRHVEGEDWELFDTEPVPGTGGIRTEVFVRGRTQYELSNHLGNVLVTISDNRIPVLMDEGISICDSPDYPPCYRPIEYYLAHVLTANDYYPFGMVMPGRKFASSAGAGEGGYRYGFNGKEKDLGNDQYEFGARVFDARLARFFSVDPMADNFPAWSPYSFSFNSPNQFKEKNGEFPIWAIIRGFVEATVEFSSQVATGMAQGKSLGEAVRDVDYADVGIAFGGGLVKGLVPGSDAWVDGATDFLQAAVDYKPIASDPNDRGLKSVFNGTKSFADFAVDYSVTLASNAVMKKLDKKTTQAQVDAAQKKVTKSKNKIKNLEKKIARSGNRVVARDVLIKENAKRFEKIFSQLPKVAEYELIYYSKKGYQQLRVDAAGLKKFFEGLGENVIQDQIKDFLDSWFKGDAAIVAENGEIRASSTSAMYDAKKDSKLLNSTNEP